MNDNTFEIGDTIEFIHKGHGNHHYRGVVVDINPDQFVFTLNDYDNDTVELKLRDIHELKVINTSRRKEWKEFEMNKALKASALAFALKEHVMQLLEKEGITIQQIPDGVPIPCEVKEEVIKFDDVDDKGLKIVATCFANQIIRNEWQGRGRIRRKVMLVRKSIDVLPLPSDLIKKELKFLSYTLFGWAETKMDLEPKLDQRLQEHLRRFRPEGEWKLGDPEKYEVNLDTPYKVGDEVEFEYLSSGGHASVNVKGIIKEIKHNQSTSDILVIKFSDGILEEFVVSNIKLKSSVSIIEKKGCLKEKPKYVFGQEVRIQKTIKIWISKDNAYLQVKQNEVGSITGYDGGLPIVRFSNITIICDPTWIDILNKYAESEEVINIYPE